MLWALIRVKEIDRGIPWDSNTRRHCVKLIKRNKKCLHFPTLWFSKFNIIQPATIKIYSLLVKLSQHIKQLRMDRNSKENNLAVPIRELSIWGFWKLFIVTIPQSSYLLLITLNHVTLGKHFSFVMRLWTCHWDIISSLTINLLKSTWKN